MSSNKKKEPSKKQKTSKSQKPGKAQNSSVEAGRLKRKRILTYSLTGFVLVLVIAAIIYLTNPNPDLAPPMDLSRFSMDYTVKVDDDPNIKILGVTILMEIDKLSSDHMIYIYKGGILSPILSCLDDSGRTVEINESTDLISIGPIDPVTKNITIKYDVRVGSVQNFSRARGDFYEDLLVFSGSHVLMFPFLDYDNLQQAEKFVSSISFTLDSDYDWKAIMPYTEPLSDERSFKMDKPTWSVMNSISKSTFCFGQFEKQDFGVGDAVYVDKAIVGNIPSISMEVLITFLNYYKNLFGELSPDAPLVLLRNSAEYNAVILGGVGATGAAISADLNTPDDCQTLSSTLYHLFFDSKIKAPNLRYPPNSWIYSGLANLHVVKSAEYFSQDVKDMFNIEIDTDPAMNYLDYMYFSIKEPDFLITNPDLEGSMDQTQNAFYMDVKVPVMLDLINYAIEDSVGGNLITALIDDAGEEQDLNIDKFLKRKCGGYYEAVLRCFSGNSLIPNYNNFNLDGVVSDEALTLRLTETDTKFVNLFSHGHGTIGYLSFPLFLLEPNKFYQDVEEMGVSYSTDEIEAEIRAFSTTLDQYLLQYAMFAKLAGYDSLTSENVKLMYTADNFDKWMIYCESIGFKYPA